MYKGDKAGISLRCSTTTSCFILRPFTPPIHYFTWSDWSQYVHFSHFKEKKSFYKSTSTCWLRTRARKRVRDPALINGKLF